MIRLEDVSKTYRTDRIETRALDRIQLQIDKGEFVVPFFSTKRDGHGLGLVLIREVVGQHGFGCGLANQPAGGAEFVLRC